MPCLANRYPLHEQNEFNTREQKCKAELLEKTQTKLTHMRKRPENEKTRSRTLRRRRYVSSEKEDSRDISEERK
jgi:hypothetical protein